MAEILMETELLDQADDKARYPCNETELIIENQNLSNIQNSFQYPQLFQSKTVLELCNSSWSRSQKDKESYQPYLRGCKWSPDGTCCLTVVNDDGMHVMELPTDLYSDVVCGKRVINILDSVIHVKQSGLVYDFCWYPGMNSHLPDTCFWLTTLQNAPIQMWDAFNGSLRCTYRGYNAVDEMEPALSVIFSTDCTKIIGGYKKSLKTFDVNRPGRDYSEHKINSPASCMATDSNLLAVGSWNTSISLYSITDMGGYKSIGKMHGHSGGVTHMKFTPDGLKLVTGARKDHRLLVWDIRYYQRPLNILNRAVDTNQRIYFDISPCGKYLMSGGTDGKLKVWVKDEMDWTAGFDVTDGAKDNSTFQFPLHDDCCNSVSIHPYRPIVATGSGQHHFVDPTTPTDDNLATECGNPEAEKDTSDVEMKFSTKAENSLVFWWSGLVPN